MTTQALAPMKLSRGRCLHASAGVPTSSPLCRYLTESSLREWVNRQGSHAGSQFSVRIKPVLVGVRIRVFGSGEDGIRTD